MGIKGLLQAVKSAFRICHVKELAGKKLGIDGYCWLHKAVYGCCVELCTGKKHNGWIQYCLSYVDMLLLHHIEVTIVFDGASLPMKQKTEIERHNNRQENLFKGHDFMKKGDTSAARNFYARAVDITPAMAAELIQILRTTRPSVSCLVAPYEADAQLSYLSDHGLIDIVVTEDSDSIPYACRDILFKLDRDGSCQRLILSDLSNQLIDKFDLRAFSEEMILVMCILSGCDYLVSD
jgi:exonuclease-1